jgi:hypothetical protein
MIVAGESEIDERIAGQGKDAAASRIGKSEKKSLHLK